MAVIKVKPTSPGRRAVVKVSHKHLYKGAPQASLLEPQNPEAGRQQQRPHHHAPQGRGPQAPLPCGRFPASKDGIPAKVSASSTTRTVPPTSPWCATPTASALHHRPARRRCRCHAAVGSPKRRSSAGNTLPIRNIPVGSTIHCVEMKSPARVRRSSRSAAPR